jgi:regulator of protease activity HflC (stomatin/prohibitin superfamily)
MNNESGIVNRERVVRAFNGWVMLPLVPGACLGAIAWLIASIVNGAPWYCYVLSILLEFVSVVMMFGFFTLQPNEARLLILFGAYRGTVREPGFFWGNPFYANGPNQPGLVARMAEAQVYKAAGNLAVAATVPKKMPRFKVSLRVRNFNSERLKVNDKRGNPIEIAAVVVWKVQDTAQAVFDVDDFENYVRVQSESALRHLASAYAYDHGEENEVTLRSGVEEVSHALKEELQARLSRAGVVVDEARLTHLAYAPEIAQAMLRRQQAEAVIAARQKIVHGAVSMVDMALKELAEKHVVQLDDERRASMVSNLMVVLCGESEVHPVVNTGTLYT